ncbi:MAG: endonuclease/exonuclease/phosphatase family protein [Treponema sp.]|nr:endonuclease/exonuclease/phosphatase family protein [Treponema sp.]
MKFLCIAGLAASFACLSAGGCVLQEAASSQETARKTLSIVTWNLQALFDGIETGTEYGDYLEKSGWTMEKYHARLTAVAEAVGQMAEKPPDILAFQEVENSGVLRDLGEGPLSGLGYGWTFFANNPGAALGLGVLSRYPLLQTKTHSITSGGETAPRPVLELRLEPEGKPLTLFVCHWKSKAGDGGDTENLRRASARIIMRRFDELRREDPELPVIIMGDLNENHDEFYRQAGSIVSALLPDDPKAAELSGFRDTGAGIQDFLVLSRQKPPQSRYFAATMPALYSPWGGELQAGSFVYQHEWETIDHFLLSDGLFNDRGWDFDSCQALRKEPFINNNGYPNAYNPRTGSGQSDHVPLLLTLIQR